MGPLRRQTNGRSYRTRVALRAAAVAGSAALAFAGCAQAEGVYVGGPDGGVPSMCTDGTTNGDETDVDCGGPSCPPCGELSACRDDSDCESGSCALFVCAPSACDDGRRNGSETGVDCGGSCAACPASPDCTLNPAAPGCGTTTPDCAANPSAPGCTTNPPNCVTNPTAPGCPPAGGGFSYPPSHVVPSELPMSSAASTLDCGESTFDSTSLAFGNWCGETEPPVTVVAQPQGSELVVITLSGFTIAAGATLRLTGDRPVVFVVRGDVTIGGTIEASADGETPGPGGSNMCGTSAGSDGSGSSSGGGGGGGGGAFAAAGASGGSGDSGDPGAGGQPRGDEALATFFGGCNGGNGGGCSDGAGAGGGAVQVSAAGVLTVTGSILVNGGDGTEGCGSEGGGGGGGSGGAILLEGVTVAVNAGAVLSANGGTGGSGSGGGDGGAGATGATPAEDGQSDGANGGGGGGGSVGRIRVSSPGSCNIAGSASPTASLGCG